MMKCHSAPKGGLCRESNHYLKRGKRDLIGKNC